MKNSTNLKNKVEEAFEHPVTVAILVKAIDEDQYDKVRVIMDNIMEEHANSLVKVEDLYTDFMDVYTEYLDEEEDGKLTH